jgi:hypothetical protein
MRGAIIVVARAIIQTGETTWVSLLERLGEKLKKVRDGHDSGGGFLKPLLKWRAGMRGNYCFQYLLD